MSDTRGDQFREVTKMVGEDGKGRQMSDSRREIAERKFGWLSREAVAECEKAMSEYAAAVLEEMAKDIYALADGPMATDRAIGYEKCADMLRARATQERER